ncbi:hypothetical protein BJY04DRAFT_217434 [Aspergillus karnatakaensis]|uniref:uncharacterized protein n=1 Tax=Aspergillus karnatakaensis TaxID=1810916 RepID=UPI003CCE3B07
MSHHSYIFGNGTREDEMLQVHTQVLQPNEHFLPICGPGTMTVPTNLEAMFAAADPSPEHLAIPLNQCGGGTTGDIDLLPVPIPQFTSSIQNQPELIRRLSIVSVSPSLPNSMTTEAPATSQYLSPHYKAAEEVVSNISALQEVFAQNLELAMFQIRAGQLVDASRLLLNISWWLLDGGKQLGLSFSPCMENA